MSRSQREPEAPWPFMLAKHAATSLGVPVELVNGLAADRLSELRAVKSTTKTGRIIWLINRDDVSALKRRMHDDTPGQAGD